MKNDVYVFYFLIFQLSEELAEMKKQIEEMGCKYCIVGFIMELEGNIRIGLIVCLSIRPSHFVVSADFRKNCSGDWSQTWWIHSLWYSPGMINFLFIFLWISAFSWPLIYQAVSAHLQTNLCSDWVKIWWANLLWASSGLINFWSCSASTLDSPWLWWRSYCKSALCQVIYLTQYWPRSKTLYGITLLIIELIIIALAFR